MPLWKSIKIVGVESYFSHLSPHLQELFKGTAVAFIFKFISAGMAFLLNVVLARLLGAEGSGVYYLSFTVVVIFATISRIGMENALIRYVAANLSIGKKSVVVAVYRIAIKLSALVSIPLSSILYLMAPWLSYSVFNKPELEVPLEIMSFAVVPLALFTLHANMLQGAKRIASSIFILSISSPLITATLSIAFVGSYGVQAASYSYVVAAFLTLVFGIILWNKEICFRSSSSVGRKGEDFLASSLPLFVVNLLTMLISWSPLLLLGVWESSHNIGIFSAASRTAMLTSFVLIAVNSIAAPKFAELYQNGNKKELGEIARNSTKIMVALAFPVLLIFIFFPEPILAIFGDDFREGAKVLIILSIGQFVNVLMGSVGYLLMMTGHERIMRNILIVMGVLSLSLNFLLIPSFGIFGAAIGNAIVMTLQNILMMGYVKKKLGISTIPFVRIRLPNLKNKGL